MPEVSVKTGEYLFQFRSFEDWVNHAKERFAGHNVNAGNTICLDAKGRIAVCGAQFIRSKADGSYPIRVYRAELPARRKGSK